MPERLPAGLIHHFLPNGLVVIGAQRRKNNVTVIRKLCGERIQLRKRSDTRSAPCRPYVQNYNMRHEQPVRTTYIIALTTSRSSVLRGLPPGLASGSNGSINGRCSSVKSLGYGVLSMYYLSDKHPLVVHILSAGFRKWFRVILPG